MSTCHRIEKHGLDRENDDVPVTEQKHVSLTDLIVGIWMARARRGRGRSRVIVTTVLAVDLAILGAPVIAHGALHTLAGAPAIVLTVANQVRLPLVRHIVGTAVFVKVQGPAHDPLIASVIALMSHLLSRAFNKHWAR